MTDEQDVDGRPRTAPASTLDVPADLTVYAALVGCHPEIDPALADPMVAAARAVRANPWSPAVLGGYVSAAVRQQGAKVNRAELTAWVRRQSAVARRRLADRRARPVAADVNDDG